MRCKRNTFRINLILSLLIFLELIVPFLFCPLLTRDITINEYFPHTSANENKKWYDPMIISNLHAQSYDPSITADKFGNVHVVWEVNLGPADDIYYRFWSSTLKNWSSTVTFSQGCTEDSQDPSIVADRFGNIHAVWHDYTNYSGSGTDADIFYRRWDNLTSSWSSIEVITTGSNSHSRYPKITVDKFGNAHLIWTEGDTNYKMWDAPTKLWQNTETCAPNDDWPDTAITVDEQGNVHIASKFDGGSRPYMRYRKRNRSGNWVDDFNFDDVFSYSQNPTIATEQNGNVHVMWTAGFGWMSGTGRIRYNATSTWSDYILSIVPAKRTYDHALVSGADGNIYLGGRVENVQDSLDFNIFARVYQANTSLWNETKVVNEGSSSNSFSPDIAVDNNNNIYMVYIEDNEVYFCKYYHIPPKISIISPINGQTVGESAPTYEISIDGPYDSIWYNINNNPTKTIIVGLTGSIDQTVWDSLADGSITLDFYAKNSVGLEGNAQIIVIKDTEDLLIPGYNIYFLIGIICVISTVLIRKRFKS